jgi:hypothetical protein
MMPQLTDAFSVNALGASAVVGMFYYGYSPFSLAAATTLGKPPLAIAPPAITLAMNHSLRLVSGPYFSIPKCLGFREGRSFAQSQYSSRPERLCPDVGELASQCSHSATREGAF